MDPTEEEKLADVMNFDSSTFLIEDRRGTSELELHSHSFPTYSINQPFSTPTKTNANSHVPPPSPSSSPPHPSVSTPTSHSDNNKSNVRVHDSSRRHRQGKGNQRYTLSTIVAPLRLKTRLLTNNDQIDHIRPLPFDTLDPERFAPPRAPCAHAGCCFEGDAFSVSSFFSIHTHTHPYLLSIYTSCNN